MGRAAEEMSGELLRALGAQATATTTNEGARLRLVGERNKGTSSDEEASS
jgi:hypothetical protein